MNRIDRLMAMVLLLQGQRVITAEKIAGHFEISVRTVYRDILALAEAGVPVVAEAGVGYSLMRGYRLPPVMFTEAEASALMTGGILVEGLMDPETHRVMDAALMKVRAVIPREQQERIARIAERTELFDCCGESVSYTVGVSQVQQALADLKVVKMSYRAGGRSEVTERLVEPMGIVYYLNRWHLLGWCRLRSDYRDFRVDRMCSLAVTDIDFEPRRDGTAVSFLKSWMDEDGTKRVRLHFSEQMINRAENEWSTGIIDRRKTATGLEVTIGCGRLDWLASWVLSFGVHVEVLDPPELKTMVVAMAEEVIGHHGKS